MIADAAQARAVALGRVMAQETHPPISRVAIAWYLVASYDLNPIHIDEVFARESGFETVIAQAMMPLGFLAGGLVKLVGIERLRKLSGDFVGPILAGEAIVTEVLPRARGDVLGGVEIAWELRAVGLDGKLRVRGQATTWHEERQEQ